MGKELGYNLDSILNLRQAKKNGICAIKEEVFTELFDELIRQETLNCPERGLMLARCRDQLKLTLTAYRTLANHGISQTVSQPISLTTTFYEHLCKQKIE